MPFLPRILFFLLVIVAIWLFVSRIARIRSLIALGKDNKNPVSVSMGLRNVLLFAIGQKKMFRNPLVGAMHFVIYAGFIIINVEILEIFLDGMLGTHRLFAAPFGHMYGWLINAFEILAMGVILVCLIFLARRNMLKLKRFISHDLDGWPRNDANLILIVEIGLMTLFLSFNASDTLLQTRGYGPYSGHMTGNFIFSQFLHPLYNSWSNQHLAILERTCWWLHIAGIFAFLNYLPYSKHLHILLAFPNAYYARPTPTGKMNNMPQIQTEVLYAMHPELAPATAGEAQRFGAKDIFELSWRNLLDAYSCTECGRCTAACPANLTGKRLSPRKIMMDTRDRLEAVGKNIKANGSFVGDSKSLLYDYITEEELRACTTCNACVEECPVSISPLEIILELRRSLVMEESKAPVEWNAMFGNTENNFAPWKFAPDNRDAWAEE